MGTSTVTDYFLPFNTSLMKKSTRGNPTIIKTTEQVILQKYFNHKILINKG